MAISKTPMCLYGSQPTVPKSDINSTLPFFLEPTNGVNLVPRRLFTLASSISSLVMISSASSAGTPPSKSFLSGISSTKSWFQFYGDGFSIRVPPAFEDIMEPEDYNAGLSLYGDKAKPKTFAARFATADGQAKDVTDLGSLKEAAKIFVPGGSTLYSARTIKIKEDGGYRNYYFYEFGKGEQHIALVAAVNSGKAIVAGATAPQSRWDDDGVRLRSAAVSLTLL
ncbi:uncharacterized protein LOC142526235 isoform X2 [Primulina tabacum]|uniref:uncharacterized protein LOC142526235 isoform X2 n=1 Tax=Primulina tabacum TaxID=48773 RepID=UPI003F5976D6